MSPDDVADAGGAMADAERAMAAIEIVVRTLGPLDSPERRKVIQAALVVLGESVSPTPDLERGGGQDSQLGELSNRAVLWMKQNGLTLDRLQHVFDISAGVATVIAAGVPGKANADRVLNAYLLMGVSGLLTSGEPTFDDKAGRGLCETFGCYDSTNHSKYMKEMGNNLVGSKERGWKLTAPGLKSAADLIRQLAE